MKTVSIKDLQANSGLVANTVTAKSEFKTYSLATANEDSSIHPIMGVLLRVDLDVFNSNSAFRAESVEEVLWYIKHCSMDSVRELKNRDERQAEISAKPSIKDLMKKGASAPF